MHVAIPLLTTIVSLVFFLNIGIQYLRNQKTYKLVWAVGLLFYTVASLIQFIREAFQISEVVFKVWYFTGGMLVPVYLGVGTVCLLTQSKFTRILIVALAGATVFAGALVFTVPLEGNLSMLSSHESLTGIGYISLRVRIMAVVMNIFGTVAFVGGALYSAGVFWSRRVLGHRFIATTLIATGGLTSATGGSLEAMGFPQLHALALLSGVIIIYAGFLYSQGVFAQDGKPLWRRLLGISL
jgi:hypothetical protein